MEPAIVIEGLTKEYDGRAALRGLSLSIGRGEIFGFLGPNGAGKTTTIRLLLDLIRPTRGRASILGHDCASESHLVRAVTGYLPGDLRLYHKMTGREIADLVAGLRGLRDGRREAEALAKELELDLDLRIGTLSKGTRQKVGVILALLGKPDVLLLDEPTSGLDPLMQHVVWDLLRREAQRGVAVFFSSHVMGEVEEICERVAILRAGALIAVEPIAGLRGRGLRRLALTFAKPVPADAFTATGAKVLAHGGDSILLEVQHGLDEVIKTAARFQVIDIRTEQPSLEEILVALYQENPR